MTIKQASQEGEDMRHTERHRVNNIKELKHCQETPIGACKWRLPDLKPERKGKMNQKVREKKPRMEMSADWS